jgi:Rrf2 family protein
MFKLYSKGCEYAIRSLAQAMMEQKDGRFQAADICEKLDIPEPFTRKIFQALVQAKFLTAYRGPGGGYELIRPASEISILEMIKAVDGADTFDHCVMGFEKCDATNPCPLHYFWLESKSQLLGHLSQTTLQDIVDSDVERRRGKAKPATKSKSAKKKTDAK